MAQHRLNPVVPLPLEDSTLEDLVEKSKDWALMHGACMRKKPTFDRDALHFAPFLLLPSTFPRNEFEHARNIQPLINELMHKIAFNYDFLKKALKTTLEVDDFSARLFKIYETVQKEGVAQPISLGLVRSDLMLETLCHTSNLPCMENCDNSLPYCCWKQVEFNTIASGFGHLGPISGSIHRYILQEMGMKDRLKNLPENRALEGLCGAILEAWKIYNNPKSVILFVVEDVTFNICDQKFHEFEIRRQNPDVFVIRRNLTEIGKRGKLTEDKTLVIDGQEVAVIYFRAGYSPDQYPTELEWDARLKMERSRAIKCPSINYHLAGTKKVQQEVTVPGVLEAFLKDEEKVSKVRSSFTGLYHLELNSTGDEAIEKALANPSRYVLKPQREGGGNNIYGEEIREVLTGIRDSVERTQYILMDLINPPVQKNYIVRPGHEVILHDVLSELGIFGAVIGDGDKILINKEVGFMLRTKLHGANEGGVAAGVGALDSPFLISL